MLARPPIYRLFNAVIGANAARRTLVREFIRPRCGDRVLDIGCGTGEMLPFMDGVSYVGFDMSAEYIDAARQRWRERATFICAGVGDRLPFEAGSFDLAIAVGVLHHLDDDEAIGLCRLADRALKRGGRLITYDGCYAEGQSRAARFVLSRDRGRNIRTPEAYKRIASTIFRGVRAAIRHDLLRIPYTHIIMECTTSASSPAAPESGR